ncbi:F-box only protein 31-like [Myotis yumanensis]|uniref:F-box only protein 31-like n=1 Tax=Myotis yumanensis TaxID=159337 RepID=UPI0038D4CFE7
MEECTYLCGLGSSRRCQCPQECQGSAETAAAEGKLCPQKRQRPAEMAAAEGKQCLQECQSPAEKAAPKSKPAPAEKHLEADASALRCAGSGGITSPMPPPHYSLKDLPVEMLVDIFASLPGTDLASLAHACTKFRHILHTDSIWRLRCREELGIPENLQKPEMIGGMSYREVYSKMFPYRNLLGLGQLDYGYRRLLNVVVDDGLCITGWMYGPGLNTHVDGPMQFQPSFRIHLTQRKSATVEHMDDFYSFSHSRHMQIQKDSHPDDLLRPGLFLGKSDGFGLKIAMLSFQGKYARVTKITGDLIWTLAIHLMRRINLPDGETFRNFKELSRLVQEIEEQVIREQQQQENRTEESKGHGWQSPSQPSMRESWAAPSEEQPVPFVLPVLRCCPGVFILFDENHFRFIWLEMEYFILLGRVQNTFQNVEAPSSQAFLEMLSSIQPGLRIQTKESGPYPEKEKACRLHKKRRLKTHNEHIAGVLKDDSDIDPSK